MSGLVISGVLSVLLVLPSDSTAFKALQTQGSVKIQEAAGITVLNEVPLQLILSSDPGMWTGVPSASELHSESAVPAEASIALAEGGLFASIAKPGEVLSVSVGDTEMTETSSRKRFKRIIAQFN